MIEIAAVHVGTPTPLAAVRRETIWSGIRKAAVPPTATLWLSEVNLSGDGQADLSLHGGVDKAVYAYPSEHLAVWSAELDETLGPAAFGENVTTIGVLEDEVRIGDVWSWGGALLQVTQPRWPCYKLALYRERADIQARLRTLGPNRLVPTRPAARGGSRRRTHRARGPGSGRDQRPPRAPRR